MRSETKHKVPGEAHSSGPGYTDLLDAEKAATPPEFIREESSEDGYDHSGASDAELFDAIVYNIFLNFSPWGGFMPKVVFPLVSARLTVLPGSSFG